MCGRYLLRDNLDSIEWEPYRDEISQFIPRFNIAPSQRCPVVRLSSRSPIVDFLTWGFKPHWTNSAISPINSRSETIWTNKLFLESIQNSRCLIPSDGFYEPKTKIEKGSNNNKPWYLFEQDNRTPFMMAGIWTRTGNSQSDSFSILTKQANAEVGQVHHRMPVILNNQDWERWLLGDKKAIETILKSSSDIKLNYYAVGDLAKKPRVDHKDCAKPLINQPENLELF